MSLLPIILLLVDIVELLGHVKLLDRISLYPQGLLLVYAPIKRFAQILAILFSDAVECLLLFQGQRVIIGFILQARSS